MTKEHKKERFKCVVCGETFQRSASYVKSFRRVTCSNRCKVIHWAEREKKKILGALMLVIIFLPFLAFAETAFETKLLNSIRQAEGNPNYGILSVKCTSEPDCRKVCLNTIRNQYRRFSEQNPEAFVDSLAKRYAPLNADNDPKNLNKNWKKNVLGGLK